MENLVEKTARDLYRAYETKDRALAERVVDANVRFTSPIDNGLDHATYFRLCWPNSETTDRFDFQAFTVVGNRAFVIYEATGGGKRFRNAEVLTVIESKVTAIEVYFGWDLPHPAPSGQHKF